RLRVVGVAFECRHAKGGKRLHRNYKGRDRRGKTFGEERPQRLILPRLDVASRPIVYQAQSKYVLLGLADRYGLSQLISLPDKKAELHLVIEILRGHKYRTLIGITPVLPPRPLDIR